jgi:hypothetical protein
LTLPLWPMTALRLPGRCHCVFYGRCRWRGPRVSCSCGYGMALHSPRPCIVRPSFPGALVGSRFSPSSRYRTPPLILFLVGMLFARLLAERTPSRPFSFSPTQARIGSTPWRCCSPPRVPLVIPLHVASVFSAMHHHLRPPGYKCHLACPPPSHLRI